MIKTHGLSESKFYEKWLNIRQRCLNKNHTRYKYYGGKGIKICDKWMSFSGFYEDMFNTYKEGLSLDRVDVNGDYSKENCRWVEWIVQANNKSNNVYIEYKNSKYSLPDFCRKFKLDYFIMYNRLHNYKWSLERAINQKIRKSRTGKIYDTNKII